MSSWTIPEICVPKAGNFNEMEIYIESSASNSLTDRLRAGQRTKHIDRSTSTERNSCQR